MIRVSSYIIGSHVGDDKALLVHGYSGAIDLVDSSTFDFLKNNENEPLPDCILEDTTSKFLIERGYLTQKSKEEEQSYVERMAKALYRKNSLSFASFTIVVTYDCNLCCPYCFEKEYAWKLKRHTLDRPTVDKIYSTIDILSTKIRNVSRNITLFGGEPLLRKNLEIVEYIIAEGKKRGMKFSAITNGVELDSFIHLIDKDTIGHLQITMDGVGETHDRTRCHREGIATFDTIIRNIRLALEKDISISIRFNADKENYSDFEKLEQYFNDCGFTKYPKFRASMSRTVNYSVSDNDDKFFSQKEFVGFLDQDRPGGRIQDFSAFRLLSKAVNSRKPISYKGSFCSSQVNGYVFDPMCRVYPCWEVIGDDRNCIGNYHNGVFEPYNEGADLWHDENYLRDSCRRCPGLLLCGGGCFAKNLRSIHCTQMTEIIKRNAVKIYNKLIKKQ